MQYGQIEFAEVSAEYKEFVEKFKPKKTTDERLGRQSNGNTEAKNNKNSRF